MTGGWSRERSWELSADPGADPAESLRAYTAARFSEFKVEAETRSRLSPAPKAASRGATPVRDTV